jgi:hypothetical protein
MSSCSARTMKLPLQPELSCKRTIWERLLADLRERGHFGRRESGAFLLGAQQPGSAEIAQAVLYDDLDPHSLDRGIVRFDGRYYGALWDRCRRSNLMVVADIHTHPFGPQQSPSDGAHPMVASDGHIALIVPFFAMRGVGIETIGMYRYRGAAGWYTVPTGERIKFLQIVE